MRRPKWLVSVALVGALMLVGAACGEETPPVAEDTPAPEETPPEVGPLGEVVIGAGEPVRIGAIQAISGDVASLGEDQVRAMNIAINDRGGELLGHPIELQVEDGGCSAEGGTTAAQRLVADPQIVGIVGTSCSGEAVPASQIMSEAGLVMISGSNTSPSLTSDFQGNAGDAYQEGYFRVAHNDLIQGQAAANFAYEQLGARTAATIHDGDPYTEGLATAFGNSFTELGGEVVLATAVSKGDTDMRPVLTEVAAANPDLMFFPIFQPEADFIVRQSQDIEGLAEREKLMGADGLLSDTFIVLPETEGLYFSGPATPEGGTYDEFVQKYRDEFGEAPIQSFHAHAYDSANMLFDAIERAAFQDGDQLRIDRQRLRDEMAGIANYQGLTGTLTCDEFGDCAAARIDVVQNGPEQETIEDVRGNVLYTFEPEA